MGGVGLWREDKGPPGASPPPGRLLPGCSPAPPSPRRSESRSPALAQPLNNLHSTLPQLAPSPRHGLDARHWLLVAGVLPSRCSDPRLLRAALSAAGADDRQRLHVAAVGPRAVLGVAGHPPAAGAPWRVAVRVPWRSAVGVHAALHAVHGARAAAYVQKQQCEAWMLARASGDVLWHACKLHPTDPPTRVGPTHSLSAHTHLFCCH